MLKNRFYQLAKKYSTNIELIDTAWQNIKDAYSNKDRHYHTLSHLEHIFTELRDSQLEPYIVFAIFYHDIIYNILKDDNEENSAQYAQNALQILSVDNITISKCKIAIIATKTHQAKELKIQELIDADLAILAQDKQIYSNYIKNIREEYSYFSDNTYIKGRQQVLKHFLAKDKIYTSSKFHTKYNEKARVNLLAELKQLGEIKMFENKNSNGS